MGVVVKGVTGVDHAPAGRQLKDTMILLLHSRGCPEWCARHTTLLDTITCWLKHAGPGRPE
jgi:hypothetical protein